MKTILVLGAGMVARPLVQYLLDQEGYHVKVASRTVSKAERIIDGNPDGEALSFDVDEMNDLQGLVSDSDIVVSLLPYTYHVEVANHCIESVKPMVTTSYVSDAMKALNDKAKDAGVIILNEIGLDPGIDHMSAMKIIHDIQKRGGEVTGFSSYCGALPSYDGGPNPFGYKFSWSPKGVLLASRNPARYLSDGNEIEIVGENLFDNYSFIDLEGIGVLEHYPNRDSMPYLATYGIQSAKTMYRATLRHIGWCETMRNIVKLGLLDDSKIEQTDVKTFRDIICNVIGCSIDDDLEDKLAQRLGIDPHSALIKRLKWLGLFDSDDLLVEGGSPLDNLVAQMQKKLPLKPGERDMVILHHDFQAEYKKEGMGARITSTFVGFGDPDGDSSVAKTVALPAAIGVKMILEGKIDVKGVHIPVIESIYTPILKELESLGITFAEKKVEFPLQVPI